MSDFVEFDCVNANAGDDDREKEKKRKSVLNFVWAASLSVHTVGKLRLLWAPVPGVGTSLTALTCEECQSVEDVELGAQCLRRMQMQRLRALVVARKSRGWPLIRVRSSWSR